MKKEEIEYMLRKIVTKSCFAMEDLYGRKIFNFISLCNYKCIQYNLNVNESEIDKLIIDFKEKASNVKYDKFIFKYVYNLDSMSYDKEKHQITIKSYDHFEKALDMGLL